MYELLPVARERALDRLARFRAGAYDCFGRRADALFEVMDALTGADRPIRSLAELTLEPVGVRGWGSFYQALHHGQIDEDMVTDLLTAQVHTDVAPGWPLMFAVDTTVTPRPEATVVDGIGLHYVNRKVKGSAVAVSGWATSWLVQVGQTTPAGARTSWAQPVHARRMPATGTTWTQMVIAQYTDLITRLGQQNLLDTDRPPLLTGDSALSAFHLAQHLPEHAQILIAMRGIHVLHHRVAEPDGTRPRGRPKVHGARFAMKDPDTWGVPDAVHEHTNPDGSHVNTQAWHHLHPRRRAPHQPWHGYIEGTVIRQTTTSPGRAPRTRWLWWAGPPNSFDLPILARAYAHRYTIEHLFRFLKQDLYWTGHTPHNAAQADRWTHIVAIAYTQLHLARPLAADHRHRWHQPLPADRISPRRVRRDFRRLAHHLPVITNPPKNTRPGPGRPPGSKNTSPRPLQPTDHKKTKTKNTNRT
jgi:hypothetical protein